jgi:uncharacterized protein YcbX
MLVDEGGLFMTQRIFPKMALLKTSIENSTLSIMFGDKSLSIPLAPVSYSDARPVQVWDDLVMAHEVSTEYSAWFSDALQLKCRLVFFPEENPRLVDPVYRVNNEHVGFADAYPLLIIGQASLDDLNDRLNEPLPMNRFRPNLVFTGGEPYEEDNWRNFQVGTNKFIGVKPCARCVLTTVDQDTALKGSEPLKTLAKYRSKNNKIYFGQNLLAVDSNDVNVGDKIVLL